MKVCIAEKPSVAREIAMVIGATQKQEGYYQGGGFQVTWSLGHLCQLKEPGDYRSEWKSWSLESLPIFPERFEIKPLSGRSQKKQLSIVKKLLRDADEIINCGDAGQEGELIQRWIIELSRIRKPMKRLWISSLTEEAIRVGFANLKESHEFDLLYAAGRSRAIGDWLLGMNTTRLFTKKYSQHYKNVLSIGRVQTPTLAMLVERHQTIQNFRSEPYWELKTFYRKIEFRYEKGRFDQEKNGQMVFQAVSGQPFTIESIQTKQGKESPPLLYDLTALQMESNRKFALSAEMTLKTLQTLYEKKLITYPRVDTRYLSQDIYPKISGIMKGLEAYQDLTEPLLRQKFKKSSRIFNDLKVTDHHAIIPTGKKPGRLSLNEQQLYALIAKRFICVFYPDCLFSKTTVKGNSASYVFKATGKQILDPGWQVVYGKDLPQMVSSRKEEDPLQQLPSFTKGESGPHQPELEKKMTRPPSPYTEASLLHAMETAGKTVDDEILQQLMKENGIGRPATRASIIETLLKRRYIERQRKQLIPTQKGIELIGLIRNPTLKSAELTGLWEKRLREIEAGQSSAEKFLEDMKTYIAQIIQEVQADPSDTIITSSAPAQSLGKCPACGSPVKEGKQYYCSNYKKGCHFRLWKTVASQSLSPQHVRDLLSKGKTELIKGLRGKKGQGKPFDAFLVLKEVKEKWVIIFEFPSNRDQRQQLNFAKDDSSEKKQQSQPSPSQIPKATSSVEKKVLGICPKCGRGQVIPGKTAWGCMNWRPEDGACDFRIWFTKGGKKISKTQAKRLLKDKQTQLLKGFKSQSNRPFNAALRLNEHFEVEYVFENAFDSTKILS